MLTLGEESYPHATAAYMKQVKPQIGLPEMRQMFDDDAVLCISIEFSEQMWTAWCIAR